MSVIRAYAWYVASVLGSLTVTVTVGVALPLDNVAPGLSETILILLFFACLTGSLTLYWYRNTYLPAQTEVGS